MTNIYDIINDLYNDDEGWGTILERGYAEQFLRTEAFRGASDDELLDIWQQVMYLLIYCGNTSYKLGDLTAEDLIFCISWCQRNIGDFELTYDSVSYFLSVTDRLLSFLKQKKAITHDSAAAKCKLKLLGPDGNLNIFQEDGSLPEAYENFRTNREPDLETKVFMQLGQKLIDLFNMMRQFFGDDRFTVDKKRACAVFLGVAEEPDESVQPELYSSFWEYFIFDYHLRQTNRRPIEVFYEFYKQHPNPDHAKSNRALIGLLETMLKIRLMIFTVESRTEDGWYRCRDFFTGSISDLSLPLDETFDMKNMLCVAHVFEDGNLFTEYLRSVYIKPVSQKILRNNFSHLLEWYRVQNPQADWETFCENNAALVIHMVGFFSVQDSIPESFRWTTNIREYAPAEVDSQSDMFRMLMRFSELMHMTFQDRKNLIQMWSDFVKLRPVFCIYHEDFMIWTLALLNNYMDILKNTILDVYSYAEKTKLRKESIEERTKIIHDTLGLEEFDPRYCSEDAFINMIFS
ncbi:MAG: hypothetical protein SPL86_09685 [Succiniclasticum sp.]|uniref:hypothetical protein n=1 Tax=Succiniclasticum sp. TaxID=2775030 RepID=UPI002A91B73A|nr:hypothetical protein [Succiniclasticum sp.]MDY6291740.1 hypothetical protein [Succiniclasticum sp.]